jgi:hypothetical protein
MDFLQQRLDGADPAHGMGCRGHSRTRSAQLVSGQQQSPYRYLLKPKAGGIALALNAMGDRFQAILDVTIVYPDGAPNFWEFLCGKLKRVIVRVQILPVPEHLMHSDYSGDPEVRAAFQRWVQQLWQDKDAQISQLLETSRH